MSGMPEGSPEKQRADARLPELLLLGIWFGVVAGLIEAVALLAFQRINWRDWGPAVHVSGELLWVSPLVDLIFFTLVSLAVGFACRLRAKWNALAITAGVMMTLTTYDWLVVPDRLRYRSCLILAIGLGVAFARWFSTHRIAALRFTRRSLPLVAALPLLAAIGVPAAAWWHEHEALAHLPAAEQGSPNVLVVIIDTLRADHVSAYGYSRETTPNIDRLAKHGVLFEDAVSPTSWSLPSHVSLVTGRYLFQHGIGDVQPMPLFGSHKPSLGGYPTLGEQLEARGYRTAAFSANRVYFSKDLGFGRGFSHFEDYFNSPADDFTRTLYGREFARVFLNGPVTSAPKRFLRALGMQSLLDGDAEGHGYGAAHLRKRADDVNRELLHWLDHGKTSGRPFFAFLNYFDAHNPYGGPPDNPVPGWGEKTAVDRYDAGVRYVDAEFGNLLRALQERHLDGNTLIVVTSDHGESLGQHGLHYHGHALYRELVQVPLVFWDPGRVPAGVRVAAPVSNVRIAETIMNVVSGTTDAAFPTASLASLWQGSEPASAGVLSELASEQYFGGDEDKHLRKVIPLAADGPMKSVLTGEYQLIYHKKFGLQLYDWKHDPEEETNLIRTPHGQTVAAGLLSQMEDDLAGSTWSTSLPDHVTRTDADPARLLLPQVAPVLAEDAGRARYYRIQTTAGSELEVGVTSPMLDPMISVQEQDGAILQTCRNPGDDDLRPPGSPDPTPAAFDDICIDDDIKPDMDKNAGLEISVPGESNAAVDLYLRIADFEGRRLPDSSFQLSVRSETKSAQAAGAVSKIPGR